MTLEQAHELQRKELISLHAENKRLKSGSFISDEKRRLKNKSVKRSYSFLYLTG